MRRKPGSSSASSGAEVSASTRSDSASPRPDERGSRRLPRRIHLPSGRIVELDDARARAVDVDTSDLLRSSLTVLSAEGVVRGPRASGVGDLPLSDVHVLRALLSWARIVREPEVDVVCDNCGAVLRGAPSEALEIGPLVDGELGDPELDAPFEFARARTLGCGISVRLAPRTLDEARALLRRRHDRPLSLDRATVTAMGVVELDGERRLSRILRKLERLDEASFAELVDLYDEAHYSPRLVARIPCGCGARPTVGAPYAHELLGAPGGPTPRRSNVDLPSVEAFEALADRIAREVLAKRPARGVSIVVDDGVPHCDDGGEPLLGSYLPGGIDPDTFVEAPPMVRLYYRTFVGELSRFSDFDLEAEVRETIEHELEHHAFQVGGDDPMDAEEREEIARNERSLVGARELSRREMARQGADFVAFVRATWPLFAVGAALLALKYCV